MRSKEFFRAVAKPNYEAYAQDRKNFRYLWNALVSLNSVVDWLALEHLNYASSVERKSLDQEAHNIRSASPALVDLKFAADTFKHVRKHQKQETIATATKAEIQDRTTWSIPVTNRQPLDASEVCDLAFSALSRFPELN